MREGVAVGRPITILLIDTEQTVVATGSGAEPEAVLTLAIGSRKTAADFFKHIPPTPQELENAIVTVEDEVVRARAILIEGSTLFTTDTELREIALTVGVPDQPEWVLTLDAMERVFERLVAVTLGKPRHDIAIYCDLTKVGC